MDWSPLSAMYGASSAAAMMMVTRAPKKSSTTRTNFHNQGTEGAVKEVQ